MATDIDAAGRPTGSAVGRRVYSDACRYQRPKRFDAFIRWCEKWTHMTADTDVRPGSDGGGDDTVVGSIDAAGSAEETYVIADISADDAWLSMPAAEAPTLIRWR